MIARWLEGKERSEVTRSRLPENRFTLFWDLLRGRFGRLMLVNLFVLITCAPLVIVVFARYMAILSQQQFGPYGAGLLIGYPVIPDLVGMAEYTRLNSDILFVALMIPASMIAAAGLSGGMYLIRNLIWTEGVFDIRDFFRGIKHNFFSAFEGCVIFTVVLFLAQMSGNFSDYYRAMGNSSAGWMMASKIIGYLIMSLMIPVCLWMVALGVNYKQSPWTLFRNAFVMTIGTFPQTIVFTAAAIAPVFLLLFGNGFWISIGLAFYITIGFSWFMLVWMSYCQWAFDKFLNPILTAKTGRAFGGKDEKKEVKETEPLSDEAALRELRRVLVSQGKSKLLSRPIETIDDGVELYQLPESFSRDDLRRLKESKTEMAGGVKQFEEKHKNEEKYVEYNRQFEQRERMIDEGKGKKKKPKRPPKMLNQR